MLANNQCLSRIVAVFCFQVHFVIDNCAIRSAVEALRRPG
jgi:hypothetical protein